jgi:uncharacterized membrane protein
MSGRDPFTIMAIAGAAAVSVACLLVLGVRLSVSGERTYAFLAWNLFLAWVPLVLASLLPAAGARAGRWVVVPVLGSWLLFFPNAPYLLTDLIHLGDRPAESPGIDFVMFPAFALAGLLIGAISLHVVHQTLAAGHGARAARLAVAACIALAGFGMYLGRVLQWNSWDMVTRPGSRLAALADRLADPLAFAAALMVSVGSAVCIALAYAAFRSAADRFGGRA